MSRRKHAVRVGMVSGGVRVAAEDIYREVRTLVRQLGVRDSLYVTWAYCQYLQLNEFEFPRDIEVGRQFLDSDLPQGILAEWTLEIIAKEAIRHADEEPRRGESLRRWGTLAQVANDIRDLENEVYAHVPEGHIHLEVMRISHRQFVWQQQKFGWVPIIRYYKMFNTPEISEFARASTGLTIDQIFLIGLLYLGTFASHSRAVKNMNVEVPGISSRHIELFLAFTSRTRRQLASMLRAEHALDDGFAYRYSSLREFPLVELSYRGQDEIACPLPTLLFWRITNGLYYSLKDAPGFPTAFGKSFQRFVGEVLSARINNAEMSILEEREFQVGKNRKDSVDWIVLQREQAALFLECKIKRLTWASKVGLSNLAALEQDIRKLAGAVVQVYKTIRDYREGRYPHLAYVEAIKVYPAIVTLEDWYLFGHDLPDRLDLAVRAAMLAAGLPIEWLDAMPYSIMSVHELDKSVGVINGVGIESFMSGKLTDQERRRWAFGAYCSDGYRDQLRQMDHLFRDEFDAMFADIAPRR
jgi:hypothetical protein